jgi:tetratricopeptide (TPR) repeat protein
MLAGGILFVSNNRARLRNAIDRKKLTRLRKLAEVSASTTAEEGTVAGKAFLSHSVEDKHVVRQVFQILGSRLAEIDETTFEGGLPNWEVIVRALERSQIFVLFATRHALSSKWVLQEIKEAHRRMKDTKLKRMLIFTLGEVPLDEIPADLRDFAIFLSLSKPSTIARAIQRHLLELDSLARGREEDFVGRDSEVAKLKSAVLDPTAALVGVSISGLALLGRAAIITRCLRDLYPSMYLPRKVIHFEVFQSCADLALELYGSVNELITPEEITEIRELFRSDDAASCGRRLVDTIRSLYQDHQYVIFSDRGGIINHRGEFTNIVRSMIDITCDDRELSLFFITQRKPVARARTESPQLVFLDIDPLDEEAARQYIVQKARIRGVGLSAPEVEEIVRLGHGHPQNYDFILEKCRQYPPASVALANLDDVYQVNRERSRALLESIKFSDNARRLLSVLRLYFNIPAEFIGDLFNDPIEGANACAELLDLHVIIEQHGVYTISPPLADAIGRDRRLSLNARESAEVARKFVQALTDYRDDGKVPVNIIDAAALAALEAGSPGNWTQQFILPSHYIYLAKHLYNRGQYKRAIEHAESAVHYKKSLTDAAFIQACRTLGMSAAQIGDEAHVKQATNLLSALHDGYANASAHFIRGFNARLSGDFRVAEEQYLAAKPGLHEDIALDRELATIYLLMHDYEQALYFAEGALAKAPDNSFLLDIVARVLIDRYRHSKSLESELRLHDVLRRLEHADEVDQGSFFALRQAERLLVERSLAEALIFADRAVERTPERPAPYLMRSRIHLARGAIRNARADRDAAKSRSQRVSGRQGHYEAELLRFEVELALKTKRWRDAIRSYEGLREFGVRDIQDIAERVSECILREKVNVDRDALEFARKFR